MRLPLLSLVVLAIAAFLLGRATSGVGRPSPALRTGDVVRVPAAATRCAVGTESGAVDFVCMHTPRARYSVVFFSEALFIYRNGAPDNPVFSARGKP